MPGRPRIRGNLQSAMIVWRPARHPPEAGSETRQPCRAVPSLNITMGNAIALNTVTIDGAFPSVTHRLWISRGKRGKMRHDPIHPRHAHCRRGGCAVYRQRRRLRQGLDFFPPSNRPGAFQPNARSQRLRNQQIRYSETASVFSRRPSAPAIRVHHDADGH